MILYDFDILFDSNISSESKHFYNFVKKYSLLCDDQ